MLTRIIAIALAASTLAFTAAQAQTGSSTGTSPSTMSPGTTSKPTNPMGAGSSGSAGSGQIAQQPGGFKASDYKTKAECLTAAKAANASSTACNSLY